MEEGALIAARLVAYAAMLLAAGVPLALAISREEGGRGLAGLASLAALTASIWWVLEAVAAMAALPLAELDGPMVRAVLEATPLGSVMALRLAALIAALFAFWRGRMALATLAASVALATVAWTGHGGASEGGLGIVHRVSDVFHLLAAATWLGALVLFLSAAIRGGEDQHLARQLSVFATTGSVVVLVLLTTGIANTLIIAGLPMDFGTAWFGLLAAKLGLFAVMLGLAAGNRWWLTPALAKSQPNSLRAIRLSLMLETAAACGIVAIVAALGTLSPA